MHRQTLAITFGIGVALGSIEPKEAFFKDVTDGDGEAALLKAQYMAAALARRDSR